MRQRRSTWFRAAVPAAVLALALTACGSDDSGDSEDNGNDGAAGQEEAQDQNENENEPTDDEPSEEESEAPPLEDVEPIEPGPYNLAMGETSGPVPYQEDGEGPTALFEITTQRVDFGTAADMDDVQWEDASAVEGYIPAWIYQTFTSVGGDNLESVDPGFDSFLYNADADTLSEDFIGFGQGFSNGCPDGSEDEVDIAVGDTVETCHTVLIPEDFGADVADWMTQDQAYDLMWALD